MLSDNFFLQELHSLEGGSPRLGRQILMIKSPLKNHDQKRDVYPSAFKSTRTNQARGVYPSAFENTRTDQTRGVYPSALKST